MNGVETNHDVVENESQQQNFGNVANNNLNLQFTKQDQSQSQSQSQQEVQTTNSSKKFKITASEAAVACGISKYALPRSLFQSKINQWDSNQDTESTEFGKENESIIVRQYERITGNKVVYPVPRKYHPEITYLGATPDALIPNDKTTGKPILLEVKCPLKNEWDENFIPPEHMAQIQLQLQVFGLHVCDYVTYMHKQQTLRIARVFKNQFYWKWELERLETFHKCLVDGKEPTSTQIPYVYHETNALLLNNWDKSKLPNTSITRQPDFMKLIPPKVYFQKTHSISFEIVSEPLEIERHQQQQPQHQPEQLIVGRKKQTPWWKRITRILFWVCALLLAISFLPVVKEE